MTYKSPEAFKSALEQRLRNGAGNWMRKRQLLVMERFLVRIFEAFPNSAVLKGGMVMEFRLENARSTKDIDLRMKGRADTLLEKLQEAGRTDLGDFLIYRVQPDRDHPEILADGLPYGGRRFRVEAQLGGKRYGDPFGLDIALSEPTVAESEPLKGSDTLSFLGLPRPVFLVYPVTVHLAEKLHAYTLPRPRPNSRVKDLPDIALLAKAQSLDAKELYSIMLKLFAARATHPLPPQLPNPPDDWGPRYQEMALEQRLPWAALPELFDAARAFINPVLAAPSGIWEPSLWSWCDPPPPAYTSPGVG